MMLIPPLLILEVIMYSPFVFPLPPTSKKLTLKFRMLIVESISALK